MSNLLINYINSIIWGMSNFDILIQYAGFLTYHKQIMYTNQGTVIICYIVFLLFTWLVFYFVRLFVVDFPFKYLLIYINTKWNNQYDINNIIIIINYNHLNQHYFILQLIYKYKFLISILTRPNILQFIILFYLYLYRNIT